MPFYQWMELADIPLLGGWFEGDVIEWYIGPSGNGGHGGHGGRRREPVEINVMRPQDDDSKNFQLACADGRVLKYGRIAQQRTTDDADENIVSHSELDLEKISITAYQIGVAKGIPCDRITMLCTISDVKYRGT